MDTSTQGKDTGQAPQENGRRRENGNAAATLGEVEQDLVYRLKGAIDQRGHYSYRLNDMSIGYAAGRGIHETAAKFEIESKFAEKFGATPHEYLEHQFKERDELRQANERKEGHSRTRNSGRSR